MKSDKAPSQIHIPSESPRKAYFRSHQSNYREATLRQPPGKDRDGRLIGSLLPNEEFERRTGLNFFLDPYIVEYVKARTGEVRKIHGTVDEDRLWRNMLSSMPLCFNLFGPLRERPEIAARTLGSAVGASIATIEVIEVEWPEPHLGDKTAFDAYVEYTGASGVRGFLGIETKYTESFGRQKIGDKNIGNYRRVAGEVCSVLPADDLLKRQVWRNTLLASAHLTASSKFEEGWSLVITLGDDREAFREIAVARSYLKHPSFLQWTSYEMLLAELEESDVHDWAKEFRARYLPPAPFPALPGGAKSRESPVEPTDLEITIGGFGGPFYSVKWMGSGLVYKSGFDGSYELEVGVSPTPQQWKSFWKKLDHLNFWEWPETFGANAVDGTWWAAAVTLGGRRTRSSGTNAYPPDGKGTDPTPEFRRFCRAVSNLVGRDFS